MSGEPASVEIGGGEHTEDVKDLGDEVEDYDAEYFSSYNDINIHKLMLQDVPRTEAYRNFIEKNKHLIKDKIVVDVGAGTGILSLFAAKAGAKHVYAIEGSEISHACAGIIGHNGFSERVTVLHGKAEDVSLPDGVKADVLISEWMGFYLLHESMLDSVIKARDKFLKQDGLILPSAVALHICPVSVPDFHEEVYGYWKDVYGFDFSPLVPAVELSMQTQPQILSVKSEHCVAKPELVTHLDLMYVALEEIRRVVGTFNFEINKNCVLHGFACWFDAVFGDDEDPDHCVLSTAPGCPETHWKQTVIMLPGPLLVSKLEVVSCNLELVQDQYNPRQYKISIEMEEAEEEDEEEDDEPVLVSSGEQMLLDALTTTKQ